MRLVATSSGDPRGERAPSLSVEFNAWKNGGYLPSIRGRSSTSPRLYVIVVTVRLHELIELQGFTDRVGGEG